MAGAAIDWQTVIPQLHLRPMTGDDITFADSLRAHAGWNQTLADWERLLAMEPDGCFIAEWNGALAGTATTTIYGKELAWIGMVLVHPDLRRRGIGKALLQRCIDQLQRRGVRCIKLDATPQGQPVYEELGFKFEWTLTRWERSGLPIYSEDSPTQLHLRHWRSGDAALIDRLDTMAFGVSRGKLLESLAKQSWSAVVAESEAREPCGYGLVGRGSRALYLGPVVAESPDTGMQIIRDLTAENNRQAGDAIFWDIPDRNVAAVTWAVANGFAVQRTLTRMYLGENAAPGDDLKQFAISGPEMG